MPQGVGPQETTRRKARSPKGARRSVAPSASPAAQPSRRALVREVGLPSDGPVRRLEALGVLPRFRATPVDDYRLTLALWRLLRESGVSTQQFRRGVAILRRRAAASRGLGEGDEDAQD